MGEVKSRFNEIVGKINQIVGINNFKVPTNSSPNGNSIVNNTSTINNNSGNNSTCNSYPTVSNVILKNTDIVIDEIESSKIANVEDTNGIIIDEDNYHINDEFKQDKIIDAYCDQLIDKSVGNYLTRFYDQFQYYQNGYN